MLNFINSLVLPVLAAALIPLLLHLLNRKKLKIIPFSSVRFLKELQSKRIRQIKLYQILIILLRMLFVIFLVLAFSRPAVRSFFLTQSSSANTTAVFILDNSYSMQAQKSVQPVFDQAKNILKDILQTFDENDHISVLTAPSQTSQLSEVNYTESEDVSQWKVSNFSPDYSILFLKAKEIFNNFPNYNRELYIISDNRIPQKAVNDSALSVLKKLNAQIYFINLAPRESFDNVSIDTAYIKTRLIELNKPVELSVILKNLSSEERETSVSLFEDQTRLAMQLINVPAQGTNQVSLYFTPSHGGFYRLKAEIEDDDLLADNNYYLSMFIPEKIEVLYVQNQPPIELKEALNTISSRTNLNIKQTDYSRWYGEALSNYQLLALNDPPQITTTFLAHLQQFADAGRDIILVPGLKLSPTDYNRLTERLVKKKLFLQLIKAKDPRQFFTLKQPNGENNLLAGVFLNRAAQIKWPEFYMYFKLISCPQPVLSFENNDPFLCRLKINKFSNLWIFGGGLSAEWSRFPFDGLFVPFLHQLFTLASNEERRTLNFTVGSPISIYLNESELQTDYQLSPPRGKPFTIIPKQTNRGLRFDFDGFNQPGHYQIFQGSKLAQLFSVNLSKQEWAEPFVDFSKLRSDLITFTPNTISKKAIQKARIGQELWQYFLALALLMLLSEMWLIKKLEGKPV